MNEVMSYLTARKYTLAEMRAMVDDPPVWMTDKMKRNLAAGLARYERSTRTTQLSGVTKSVEQQHEQHAKIRAALDQAEDDIEAIREGVRDGEFDPKGAEQAIKVILRDVRKHREALDRIDGSVARIKEVADTDPADWQKSNIERFPALEQTMPVVTREWVTGQDHTDPFGG